MVFYQILEINAMLDAIGTKEKYDKKLNKKVKEKNKIERKLQSAQQKQKKPIGARLFKKETFEDYEKRKKSQVEDVGFAILLLVQYGV